MPNPVPTNKQAIVLAVGTLCAAAALAVLGGVMSSFSGIQIADKADPGVTTPAPVSTCPAGTTETADACVKVIVSPAPAPVQKPDAVAEVATEPAVPTAPQVPAPAVSLVVEDDDAEADRATAPNAAATHEREGEGREGHENEEEHEDSDS